MPFGEPKYTDEQRDAIASAVLDRGIRPARRVVELAGAGELLANGAKLKAFVIPEASVRDLARKERNRRSGKAATAIAKAPPRDAVEQLRQRLVSIADTEVKRHERASRSGKLDTNAAIRTAKLVREVAALPGPDDPRPSAPGRGPMAERQGGEVRSGPGAALLADFRGAGTTTAPEPTRGEGENTQAIAPSTTPKDSTTRSVSTPGRQGDENDDAPGAFVRDAIAALPDGEA